MTQHLVAVREYTSAAEMVANAAAIRKSLWAAKPTQAQEPAKPVAMVEGPRHQIIGAPRKTVSTYTLPDGFAGMIFARHKLAYWGENKPVCLAGIIRLVCDVSALSKEELLAHRRTKVPVLARQLACWLARTFTMRSLPEIGRVLGGRDHTTVLHAVRTIDALLGDAAKRIALMPAGKAAVAAWGVIYGASR